MYTPKSQLSHSFHSNYKLYYWQILVFIQLSSCKCNRAIYSCQNDHWILAAGSSKSGKKKPAPNQDITCVREASESSLVRRATCQSKKQKSTRLTCLSINTTWNTVIEVSTTHNMTQFLIRHLHEMNGRWTSKCSNFLSMLSFTLK